MNHGPGGVLPRSHVHSKVVINGLSSILSSFIALLCAQDLSSKNSIVDIHWMQEESVQVYDEKRWRWKEIMIMSEMDVTETERMIRMHSPGNISKPLTEYPAHYLRWWMSPARPVNRVRQSNSFDELTFFHFIPLICSKRKRYRRYR